MLSLKVFLKYWLPVYLWMAMIFFASTDTFSSDRTSRIIGPLMLKMNPDIDRETLALAQILIRKCGHLTEYGILALLVWRAIHKPHRNDARTWRWSEAGMALVVAVLYAAGDEYHQSFIPTRLASVGDVALDGLGAGSALLILWVCRKKKRNFG